MKPIHHNVAINISKEETRYTQCHVLTNTQRGIFRHINVHQQSHTFIHSVTHTNMYCTHCFGSHILRACSQPNREQRPGSTLACGRLYLKIIRGRRGQQGQIMGCQMHSVLLFITWHVYLCVCPLLGRIIY